MSVTSPGAAGQRFEQGAQWRDADATGDEGDTTAGSSLGGEGPVGPFREHSDAGTQPLDPVGVVAQILHGDA